MIELRQNREDMLDIVWAAIRNENEGWLKIFPDSLGCSITRVAEITGWSYMTCHRLMTELVERGQLSRKWNHQHQSYWSGHFSTPNELPNGGNPVDPEVSEIPF